MDILYISKYISLRQKRAKLNEKLWSNCNPWFFWMRFSLFRSPEGAWCLRRCRLQSPAVGVRPNGWFRQCFKVGKVYEKLKFKHLLLLQTKESSIYLHRRACSAFPTASAVNITFNMDVKWFVQSVQLLAAGTHVRSKIARLFEIYMAFDAHAREATLVLHTV